MYSRYPAPRSARGRSKDSVPSAWRYRLVGLASGGGVEGQRPVGVEIQVGGLGLRGRPRAVGPPAVRPRLKGRRPPGRRLASPMEVIAEERRLDRLAELARRSSAI